MAFELLQLLLCRDPSDALGMHRVRLRLLAISRALNTLMHNGSAGPAQPMRPPLGENSVATDDYRIQCRGFPHTA
jgi:hypothetical protein